MSDKPLTAEVMADALDHFWNAAISESHHNSNPVGCMAVGIQAVANRLREHAAETAPVETPKPAPPPAADHHATARARGFTGDVCPDCGNYTMVRNGSCLKCQTCGSTTGCS